MEKVRAGQRKSTKHDSRSMGRLEKLKGAEAKGERLVTLQSFLNGVVARVGSSDWQEHLLTVHDKIEQRAEMKLTAKGMYKGELIQKHGKKEAMRFINTGKWRKSVDKDGDEIYDKVQKTDTRSKARTRTTDLSKHRLS